MYLMTCTRPDLAYPLSLLSRYVAPGRHRKVHWDAAKRVLRYLCSTSGMGLVLGGRARVVLTGHADASWVDDLAMQRSSLGYTFSLGSGFVSWQSTCSSSVLSSSCEAEIYAGAMAAQELRLLIYLLTDLGEAPRSSPVLYANTADVFTKALQPCDHQRFPCFAFLDWSCDLLFSPTLPMGDHFLALDPTDLTVDLLEKHLLAAETSVVAVGAARGTPRTPFVEGCSSSPLAPSYASFAVVDILGAEDVGVASALVTAAPAEATEAASERDPFAPAAS
ncbi:unnamed protein product [Closterium sp. NIES-53]